MKVFLAAVCSCYCYSALCLEFHCLIGRGQECAMVRTPQFWTVCDFGLYRAGCLSCYTLLLIDIIESYCSGGVCDQSGAWCSCCFKKAVLIIHLKKTDF
jgi:hypothetical protein